MPRREQANRRANRGPGRRGIRLRAWMTVNTLLLSAMVLGVYHEVLLTQRAQPAAASADTAQGAIDAKVAKVLATKTIPVKAAFLDSRSRYFGVMADNVPWNAGAVQRMAAVAGVVPNMSETFTTWRQDYPAATVADSYARGELPVLTWEPWAAGGTSKAQRNQPAYALAQITEGVYDPYITGFAQAVAAAQWPVVIRFAHEMNGDWYPWAEGFNGNAAGSYVAAWRHVHDLFTRAGANNVIWMWSPNILRGAQPKLSLAELYPGDGYVDWVGLSAYDDSEATAAAVLGPTMAKLRAFTAKPVLLAETGAQPGPQKAGWTTSLFAWMAGQPDVIGLVWSEYRIGKGGSTADWRFDADPATLDAFRTGIRTLLLQQVAAG